MKDVFEKTGFSTWNKEQDRGRSWEEGIALMEVQHPEYVHVYEAYAAGLVPAHSTLVAGTTEIIERLHVKGVGLYGITNAARESFEAVKAASTAVRLIKATIVSGEHQLVKPDLAIFKLCLEEFGLDAKDCIFVDDLAANCDGAKFVGMDAIHFVGADDLEQKLVSRGIL
nr:HAD-IA family hydrolase [Sulfitobacter undariae]